MTPCPFILSAFSINYWFEEGIEEGKEHLKSAFIAAKLYTLGCWCLLPYP